MVLVIDTAFEGIETKDTEEGAVTEAFSKLAPWYVSDCI